MRTNIAPQSYSSTGKYQRIDILQWNNASVYLIKDHRKDVLGVLSILMIKYFILIHMH